MYENLKFKALNKKRNLFYSALIAINFDGKPVSITVLSNLGDTEIVPIDEVELLRYSGRHDKNNIEIYAGDIIELHTPTRDYQEESGDNIPDGYFKMPLEPYIKIERFIVRDKGIFVLESIKDGRIVTLYNTELYNVSDITTAFDSEVTGIDWYDEEGDLVYLLKEYDFNTEQELIDFCSGSTIIGNIYQNKELLKQSNQ
jgi:uncharacterized phage protein (TIGR01671 family)